MTLTYSGTFYKLLFRWRGSVWKAVSFDLLVYMILYYAINLSYRFWMNDYQKRHFEKIVVYTNGCTGYIPLTFVLGFFVSQVMSRWYLSFRSIAWPDSCMIRVMVYLSGNSEERLLVRRNVARWITLSLVLCWRLVTIRIRKRFPTTKHIIRAGFMTQEEAEMLENFPKKHGNWMVPLTWVCNLCETLFNQQKLSDGGRREIMGQIDAIRQNCQQLMLQDWIVIPLVYTQVVAIATYGYFGICLIGRQLLDPAQELPGRELDHYVPIFTILQFVFYMGWMKVGEDLMRPFGEDDDDFEFNYILERHHHIAYCYADYAAGKMPPMVKDKYWGVPTPDIPYTTKSLMRRDIVPGINIPPGQIRMIDENDDLIEEPEEIDRFLANRQTWTSNPIRIFTRPRNKTTAKVIKMRQSIVPAVVPMAPKKKPSVKQEPASVMPSDVQEGKVVKASAKSRKSVKEPVAGVSLPGQATGTAETTDTTILVISSTADDPGDDPGDD